MGIIVKPETFSAGNIIIASEHNNNFDTIYNEFNGNITNANIDNAAAIAYSKLNLGGSIQSSDLASSVAMSATGAFTDSTGGYSGATDILTITHSLGRQYVNVTIWDNNDIKVEPDDTTATSTSVTTVDLSSFGGPLTGTWNWRISS